jgi:hypothetical protein
LEAIAGLLYCFFLPLILEIKPPMTAAVVRAAPDACGVLCGRVRHGWNEVPTRMVGNWELLKKRQDEDALRRTARGAIVPKARSRLSDRAGRPRSRLGARLHPRGAAAKDPARPSVLYILYIFGISLDVYRKLGESACSHPPDRQGATAPSSGAGDPRAARACARSRRTSRRVLPGPSANLHLSPRHSGVALGRRGAKSNRRIR